MIDAGTLSLPRHRDRMFYREHGVAHIHAVYGEYEISVEVETLRVHGHFPPRAQKLVLEWMGLHAQELFGELGTG